MKWLIKRFKDIEISRDGIGFYDLVSLGHDSIT
jgi:hypothetical protein